MKEIYKLIYLLSPAEKRRAILLVGMVLIMALFEVIGVASIMPLMAVLANPELIQTNALLSLAYAQADRLGVRGAHDFLFLMGCLVFILLVFSLFLKMLTTYYQLHFALLREYSVGRRLVNAYLDQPYAWFLYRHSADLGKTVLSEVSTIINVMMVPLITLISQIAVAIAILSLLMLINWTLALTVVVAISFTYGIIFGVIRKFLIKLGRERLKANQIRYTALSEVFGAIKEVKVSGLEKYYLSIFSKAAEIYARNQAAAQAISQLPRCILEAVAFGGMILIVLYMMSDSGSLAIALPVITLYAFAGYRLMPAMQQIYSSLTQLRFASPSINAVYEDLKRIEEIGECDTGSSDYVHCNEGIKLRQAFYRYPNSENHTLKNITLSISSLSMVGFVGATGSGKTTIIDLILGLLVPESGDLIVDGTIIDSGNRRGWQQLIGYVPQQIFLVDDTVIANIALGVNPDDVDLNAVEWAAKIANLHEFVVNDLPYGYMTTLGERGVRLSGGQRQRIGIARALYRKPKILVLDEATSALDTLTEKAVMDAISNLSGKMTIILIAHRLSTIRQCDYIYFLEGGYIKASGTYHELLNADPMFLAMASA